MAESVDSSTDQTPFDWKGFSRKTWVVVAAGLFLPPLGIALVWLKPDWSRKAKWIATGLMGLMFISILSNEDKNSTTSPPTASSSTDDEMKSDAAKAAILYKEWMQLGMKQANEVTDSITSNTQYKPDPSMKRRYDELTDELEAIEAKYTGARFAEFDRLMKSAAQ